MKQSQRIVKNVFAGGAASVLGGPLQLASTLLAARYLSVADFGAYAFMLAFAFVLQRFSDMGISSILMRDLAITPKRTRELLGAALSLGWVVMFALGAMLFVASRFFPVERSLGTLTAVMGVASLLLLPGGYYGAVLRAQENNEINALGFILHKALLLALVVLALALRASLPGLVAANVVSNLGLWLFYRRIVVRQHGRTRLSWKIADWKYLLSNGIPVGAAGVIRLLGEQGDVIMLSVLAGSRAAGLFAGPYKIAAGLRFMPQAMIIALFPLYSREGDVSGSKTQFLHAYQRGLKGFLLLAIPFAVLFLARPEALTLGLLGHRYLEASTATQLLGVGVLLLFIGSPFPFLLTALHDQRYLCISSLGALILRLLLDLLLIRGYGYLAPCLSLIISETLLVTVWILRMSYRHFPADFVGIAWRPGVAGALMFGIMYVVAPDTVSLLIPVALLGGCVYVAVIVLLGVFSDDELWMLREGLGFFKQVLVKGRGALAERPS